MITMSRNTCPTPDELRGFLNEQLEEALQAEIGIHVDTCPHCQKTLDELTSRDAYELRGLSTKSFTRLPGDAAAADDLTDPPEYPETGPERSCDPDAGAELSGDLAGEPTLDHVNLEPSDSGGETSDHQSTTDPDEPEGPRQSTAHENTQSGPPKPRIPAYELLEVLGEGGMGVVYKARQRGLNRLVAVKMIRGDLPSRSDRLARFLIEAEAVARLHHSNIVQIYEIGEAGGAPFVSLEMLEGGSLDHRLASTPQPGREAAELVTTLARAVQVAHTAGIVHRDLKPSNILFTADGIPKITDFGLAKRLEADSRQTESGQIMGSPSYMAPEQASGHSRDIGPAADVYALGAILYEMLTGHPPFKGETPVETVRMVLDADPVPPSRLVPRIERDLETICLKCLAKEPHKRYSSADDLAADLERYCKGETIHARRTPMLERGFKWSKRHPMRAGLLFLGATTAGLAVVAGLYYDRHQRDLERAESQHVGAVTVATSKAIYEAQELMSRGALSDAKTQLTSVQSRLEAEPKLREKLSDLYDNAGSLLAQVERRVLDDQARNRERNLYEEFLRQWDETLFLEAQFTGVDLPTSRKQTEQSARAALAAFGKEAPSETWAIGSLPESLTSTEREVVRDGCYELLLVLAEAVDPPAEGLRLLEAAARGRPLSPAYHLARADCLSRAGNTKAAEGELKAAVVLKPATVLDHYLLGKEAYKHKAWRDALQHFDEALLVRPDHFWSHCLSAISNLHIGRALPAKAELIACLQSRRDFAWLYNLRGFASYQVAELARSVSASPPPNGSTLSNEIQLQFKGAEIDYGKALALLEQSPNAELRYAVLVNRGLLWLKRGDLDKAVADLESAIKLDEKLYQAHESLAQARLRQKRHDEAVEQITRAIALAPKLPSLYRGRAAFNLARKDPKRAQRAQALRDLDQAIQLEAPGNAVLALDQTNRAKLLAREDHDEAALAACESALRAIPDHAPAHELRLELLRKLKRYGELIKSCDVLLAKGKTSADLYEQRGLARQDQRDYAGAIEDFTQAIARRPGSAALLARRGELYLMADAPRSALRDFDAAIRLDSSNPDAYAGRGLARVTLSQYSGAVSDAAQSLRVAEPDARRLFNAARIHAKAAVAASGDVRRRGKDAAALVDRYQDQAVALIREALKRQPANQRVAFLNNVIGADPALKSLRRRLKSIELTSAVSASAAAVGQPQP
jgi:serine/threonine protein kinase/Tfp pilus assembly protein PilF